MGNSNSCEVKIKPVPTIIGKYERSFFSFLFDWYWKMSNNSKNLLWSIIFAILIVHYVRKDISFLNVLYTIILTTLLYIIFSSATGSNLEGSLNPTAYPIPPHLGLYGVSKVNKYPYYYNNILPDQ